MENSLESRENIKEFNLLTNFEETINAMAEVEGQDWLLADQNDPDQSRCIGGAVEYLHKLHSEGLTDEYLRENPVVTDIYGVGGYSRWFIMLNGEVRFSQHHHPEKAKKAEALGFKLF